MPLDADDLSLVPEVDRYAASGVDVAHLNVGYGEVPWAEHMRALAAFRAWARPDRYDVVADAASIARIRAEGELAIAFGVKDRASLRGRQRRAPRLAGRR